MTLSAAIRLAAVLLLLTSCATKAPSLDSKASPESLYKEAKRELEAGRWDTAITRLQTLEARYPFGVWSEQAALDLAYAQHRNADRGLALTSIDHFIKLHPNHPFLDYALYLKGLATFDDQRGIFSRWGRQDLSERDQKAARQAFLAFKELVERFPKSRYAPDALSRMHYLVNSLAQSELHVARYYYKRGAYVAAVNRAQAIVTDYQRAPVVEEALELQALSFKQMGLTDMQRDIERVRSANFPNREKEDENSR